jgi:hypothetical protein
LKRLVALKMILAAEHAGAEEKSRFRTEAEAVARCQHPNIVAIYEVGEQQGRPYFSLEFVEGGSLDKLIASKPVTAHQSAQLVETIARAVHIAHQRGIIHRDLKPSNILLTADGVPKIADFGLAKCLEGDAGRTASGAVLGTPSYMAPEQAPGKVRTISPATDVYALGAILYELLTGHPPFRGESLLETLQLVCTQDPVPPSHLQANTPRDIETICLKCLRKFPDRRYASAADLADDLRCFIRGEPISARPTTPWELAWKSADKFVVQRPWVALTAAVAFLIWVASIIIGWGQFLGWQGSPWGPAAVAVLAICIRPSLRSGVFAISSIALGMALGWASSPEGTWAIYLCAGAGLGLLLGTVGRIVSWRLHADLLTTIVGAFFGIFINPFVLLWFFTLKLLLPDHWGPGVEVALTVSVTITFTMGAFLGGILAALMSRKTLTPDGPRETA